MTEQELYQYIEMTPFRGREPIFRNTKITVKHIIDDFAKGMSAEEILSEHKELSKNHLHACFVYMKNQLEEFEQLRLYAGAGSPSFWSFLFPSKK